MLVSSQLIENICVIGGNLPSKEAHHNFWSEPFLSRKPSSGTKQHTKTNNWKKLVKSHVNKHALDRNRRHRNPHNMQLNYVFYQVESHQHVQNER